MEEDPIYYQKISALIEKAIDDHKAQRLSELEFLNVIKDAREQVIRPKHDDVPQRLKDQDNAVAFFHVLEKQMAECAPERRDVREDAADAAEAMLGVILRRRVVNWTQRQDIQNDMRNDLDDYLFDEVRDSRGYALAPETMDDIIDRVLSVARARMPD